MVKFVDTNSELSRLLRDEEVANEHLADTIVTLNKTKMQKDLAEVEQRNAEVEHRNAKKAADSAKVARLACESAAYNAKNAPRIKGPKIQGRRVAVRAYFRKSPVKKGRQ
jgi:hypothetical protein